MSGAVPAEEIADDFRHSLEYLQSPDRYAINNFTVIAKENTEHADAISNVLVDHIRKAPPHHKLPALYVLDSIAKNIGTPYSLFLGHKLYSVFMESYSSVDSATRKKLDEMLKTWKAPVPGSIDPTPVFPLEITRKIENALIQARTAALKHDQGQTQSILQKRPTSALAMTRWRNTPTPPQQAAQLPPPPSQQYNQQQMSSDFSYSSSLAAGQHRQLSQSFFQPNVIVPVMSSGNDQTPNTNAADYRYQSNSSLHSQNINGQQLQFPDMNILYQDVEQLIANCTLDFTSNQMDARKMNKLQALMALKDLLSKQSLPADQLQIVRRQVDELQAAERSESAEQGFFATPTPAAHHPAVVFRNNFPVSTATQPVLQPSTLAQKAHVPFNVESLIAKASETTPIMKSTQSNPTIASQPKPVDVGSLLASLAKSGLLPQAAPAPLTSPPSPTVRDDKLPTTSITELLARATGSNLAMQNEELIFTSISVKKQRPELSRKMLDKRSNQCVQCGLRFMSSEEGRKRKASHMDWHFRANQRIQDAAKGIQSRSWFVGELEWIKSKDLEDQLDPSGGSTSFAANGGSQASQSSKYVSVPSDPENHQPCPICQERFDTGFNQDIQDWVWLDAVKVGAKIYHESCFADLRRDGHESRDKTATPDSILGKRKADVSPMHQFTKFLAHAKQQGTVDVSPAKKYVTQL